MVIRLFKIFLHIYFTQDNIDIMDISLLISKKLRRKMSLILSGDYVNFVIIFKYYILHYNNNHEH